jgi:hypothetical protein
MQQLNTSNMLLGSAPGTAAGRCTEITWVEAGLEALRRRGHYPINHLIGSG